MITIQNKQTAVAIDTPHLRKDARRVLKLLDYSDYDLAICLVNNSAIQQYNREYRHKDEPTDILSFPFHQLAPGERIQPKTEEDKNLGDLIISLEFVHAQHADHFYPRMQKLLVHGVCHLLGHDHDTPETDAIMLELEKFLLEKLTK